MGFAVPPTETQRRGRRTFLIGSALAVLFLAYQFHGCYFPRSEVVGTYTARHFLNNRDSVQLRPDGSYRRWVHDYHGQKVLDMRGRWRLEGDRILDFDPWYLNFDDDLVRWPEKASDTSGSCQVLLARKSWTISFQVYEREGEHFTYYQVE